MRRVRSTNTTPEKRVRSLLHKLGFRFRLRRNDLPGKPDIVLPKHRTVIFVHGCFWHRHQGCPRATTPSSRQEYWLPKFGRTIDRDKENQQLLGKKGWNVVVVWECGTKDLSILTEKLLRIVARDESLVWQQQSLSIAMAAEKQADYNTEKNSKIF